MKIKHTFIVKKFKSENLNVYYFGHVNISLNNFDTDLAKTLGLTVSQFRRIIRRKWKNLYNDGTQDIFFIKFRDCFNARNYFEEKYMIAQKLIGM